MLHRGMSWVRLVAQRIQKQNVESLQLFQGAFGDITVVSQIRRRAETKAINLCIAMNKRDGLEDCTKQFQQAFERS